tara:strand:- start:311 stop:505 length:195 start_codon:yes stop_codon:yes gene_type:complete
MIDFQILENDKTTYISWSKLCKNVGITPYMPTTPELAAIKMQLAKERSIDADAVQVRMDGDAML